MTMNKKKKIKLNDVSLLGDYSIIYVNYFANGD